VIVKFGVWWPNSGDHLRDCSSSTSTLYSEPEKGKNSSRYYAEVAQPVPITSSNCNWKWLESISQRECSIELRDPRYVNQRL
jgi:hypothetical protein